MSKPTAFATALDALRRYILAQGLRPGDTLPPVAELARLVGVSQATLREALRAWEAAGILRIRHGVGAQIRAYNYAPLLENLSFSALFEPELHSHVRGVWLALELGLVPLALDRLSVDDLSALEALTSQMLDDEHGLEAEYRLHARLAAVLGNPLLVGLLRWSWLAYQETRRQSGGARPATRLRYALHVELVRALRARDAAAAQAALRRYFELLATTDAPGA